MKHLNVFGAIALALMPVAASAQLYQDASNTTALSVRDPARQASTEIDAVINNPAGTSFLKQGWHFSLNGRLSNGQMDFTSYNQTVTRQTRNVIPSLQAAYKKNKFAFSLSFGEEGGYGWQYETDNPWLSNVLNSASEQAFASIRNELSDMVSSCNKYDQLVNLATSYGGLYNFSTRIGAAYQINEHWSVAVGLRMNYYYERNKMCVNRRVRQANGQMSTPETYFNTVNNEFLLDAASIGIEATSTAIAGMIAGLDVSDLTDATTKYLESSLKVSDFLKKVAGTPTHSTLSDMSNHGFGISPILSIHYQNKNFDIAAKYEFATKIHAKEDGTSFHIPSLLQLGASWKPLNNLKIALGGSWSYVTSENLPGRQQQLDLSNGENIFNFVNNIPGAKASSGINTGLHINSWDVSASVTYSPIENLSLSAGYKYAQMGYMYGLFTQNAPLVTPIQADVISAGIGYNINDGIQLNFGVSRKLQPQQRVLPLFYSVERLQATTAAAGINVNF